MLAAQAWAAPSGVHFAVLGGVPANPAQVAPVRELLAAIASQPEETMILDDGNLKGAQEPCTDTLLQDREALLNSSTLPLVLVPGAHDWVDCQQPTAGGFDPLERLDFLRDLAFATADSMGISSIPLERESDVTRFRNFRENALWQSSGLLFVTLNVPGHNNHYLDAGGRNGEFEDRTIANRAWLEHALRVARQHRPAAIVIAIEGDPGLGAAAHRGTFDWLGFRETTRRDGYQEFKQDLLKFAQQYDGTLLLINQTRGANPAANTHGAPAFRLNPPLHRKNGGAPNKLWQLEINPQADPTHWVDVELTTGREVGVKASLRSVPAHPPAAASASAAPASSLLPLPAATPGSTGGTSTANPGASD